MTSPSAIADWPAASRRAIAFACDEGYAPFALMAAERIAALSPGRGFDILLCGEPAPEVPPTLSHLGLRRVSVDTAGVFRGLGRDARRTESTYMRLALPEVLAVEYDRILYLDSDVEVQGGDWEAVLGLGLGGCAVGAVRDHIQWRRPERRAEEWRRLGRPATPYFNAGVLLLDVAEFLSQDVMGRALRLGRERAGAMVKHDQSALNVALEGRWAELSPAWNWQYSDASRLFEAMEGANLVHFIGPVKPWRDPEGRLPPRFGRRTAAFLAEHFPERACPLPPPGPARRAPAMRKLLWRHWRAAGRMAAYLGRFPDDRVVRAPAGS